MLRDVLDESRDGLLVLDERGIILEGNKAAAGLLGHERSRLAGKPFVALVSLADRHDLRNELGRLGATAPASLALRLLHADAECIASLRPLPGSPRRIAVALMADGPLPQEPPFPMAERLNSFVLRFPYAVVALRRDLTIAFANGHARALFGAAAVRTGSPFGESMPTELRAVARRVVQVRAPLRPTEVELPDGKVLRIVGLAPTADEPAVLFLEDISERRRQERVMHEFLRNAAHQLRTPVAGITAAIETLQAGAKDRPADRDRFLDHVERHADRLTSVARGLLLLARAQAGEAPPVDFVELQPLLDRLVQEAVPGDDVRVLADCPPRLAAIAAPDLLYEAVAALVDNALTHAREGEVRISAAEADGHVLLTVSDQGPGILPEFLDRVFEPFFRLTAAGEGYGLGLAIAAQVVRAMGGDIDVSSSVGAGTSFTVKLPSATVVP
jgi:two-component system, OmpR family, phosphate regulon sensor histidine kinase PhoR